MNAANTWPNSKQTNQRMFIKCFIFTVSDCKQITTR